MMFDSLDTMGWLAAASVTWSLLHLYLAENDAKVMAKTGLNKQGAAQGRRTYALLYSILSLATWIGQTILYRRVWAAHPEVGSSWPKLWPALLRPYSLPETARTVMALASAFGRFAAVWLLALANFTTVTPPGSKTTLKHDGFHAQRSSSPNAEGVGAYGLGRLMRHPVNAALATFALAHMVPPTDSFSRWAANLAFWAPQIVLAAVGCILHSRRLRRNPAFKRYLSESPALFNPFALFKMPRGEYTALLTPATFATLVTAAFFLVPRLNRLLYAPASAFLPALYMGAEAFAASPAVTESDPAAMLKGKAQEAQQKLQQAQHKHQQQKEPVMKVDASATGAGASKQHAPIR